MSTLKTNTIKNTDDVEMYLAKAWVNFNGTGTVAIRAAGNVSSITDNGTGDYTVNFTNALPDADYSVTSSANRNTTSEDNASVNYGLWTSSFNYATSSVKVSYVASGAQKIDAAIFNVAVFR